MFPQKNLARKGFLLCVFVVNIVYLQSSCQQERINNGILSVH